VPPFLSSAGVSMTILRLDYETKSEISLPDFGLDIYAAHPSTKVILCAYAFDNDDEPELWDHENRKPFPRDVAKALADPHVEKKAFNAQFERIISKRILGIDTPYEGWRCTMARAYMMAFVGGLGEVGAQMGIQGNKAKDDIGKSLIKLFSMPQRVTKAQPFRWCNGLTHPDEWRQFGEYCKQDVRAERHIDKLLSKFYIPEDEWRLYELDQKINDRGLPIDMQYVENAIWMAAKRKKELLMELGEVTGLANANSGAQILPWLKARGYPFNDLKKDTVTKVLREHKEASKTLVSAFDGPTLTDEAVEALKIRQNANRTSVAKYVTIKKSVGEGDKFRFSYQYAGATRTQRWAGRRLQGQNLPRTPKIIEKRDKLGITTDLIRNGDYDGLSLWIEPMTALVGCIRSAIRAPAGKELRVSDLSSIETCVIAWLSDCERLLKVIRAGYDPYKDFAVILYKGVYADFGTPEYEEAYASVTKQERNDAKPAVLGAGYRLSGGELDEGKRTGLWGYAENMGIDLTQEASAKAVEAYRKGYSEVPVLWKVYEDAVAKCVRTQKTQVVGPLRFEYKKPFLMVRLPSGRYLYYMNPKLVKKVFTKVKGYDETGEPIVDRWVKTSFTYMGKQQNGKKWIRLFSHGGKLVENFVQAIARDVLKYGMFDADDEGFEIVGHVHDEIKACEDIDDDYHTVELLGACMTRPRDWAPGLPLGYGGWSNPFYMKD
jgi:DNA polymerase